MHICLQRGLGITLCPEAYAASALAQGSLVRLRWQGEAMETSILMIWHAEKWCSPLLRHFMETCEAVFGLRDATPRGRSEQTPR